MRLVHEGGKQHGTSVCLIRKARSSGLSYKMLHTVRFEKKKGSPPGSYSFLGCIVATKHEAKCLGVNLLDDLMWKSPVNMTVNMANQTLSISETKPKDWLKEH